MVTTKEAYGETYTCLVRRLQPQIKHYVIPPDSFPRHSKEGLPTRITHTLDARDEPRTGVILDHSLNLMTHALNSFTLRELPNSKELARWHTLLQHVPMYPVQLSFKLTVIRHGGYNNPAASLKGDIC